jgi:FkbM family methyltransferase
MGIGVALENGLQKYRAWRLQSAPGALGEFHRAGGNAVLYRNLPVRSTDVVVDVGGYRGDWTAEMCWRYGCRAVVLEPIPSFAADIGRRFERNDRVVVIPAGLGPREGRLQMAVAADGSSFVRETREAQRVLVDIMTAQRLFDEQRLDDIACLKINIEGAEYDLLDAMAEDSLLARVRCLLVQFHDVGPSTSARLERVRAGVARTHARGFCFELVWERWDRALSGA